MVPPDSPGWTTGLHRGHESRAVRSEGREIREYALAVTQQRAARRDVEQAGRTAAAVVGEREPRTVAREHVAAHTMAGIGGTGRVPGIEQLGRRADLAE